MSINVNMVIFYDKYFNMKFYSTLFCSSNNWLLLGISKKYKQLSKSNAVEVMYMYTISEKVTLCI